MEPTRRERLVEHDILLSTAIQRASDRARLRAMLEAASDAFFDVDLSDSTIRWSRGVTLLFGHDPDDLGGSVERWQRLIHPDDAERVLASGRALLPSPTGIWSEEFRLRRADGTYAWVRVRSYVVRDQGRPSHVVGAISDMSELRQRERELHALSEDLVRELEAEREERMRADLLLRSPSVEVLGDIDLRTGRISFSPNVETVFGRAAEEIADLEAFMRFTDPEDGPRQLEAFQRAIASGAASWSSPGFRFRRADGAEVVIASHGFLIRDEAGMAIRAVGAMVRLDAGQGTAPGGPVPIVTERQRRILGLVREGRTNKEIARELGISEQAAKVQVSKLLRKFGVSNRAALAVAGRSDASL